MRCPSCGGTSQSEGSYCIYCGMRFPPSDAFLRPDDAKSLRNELIPIVNGKDRTDIEVSTVWVILPFIALLVATVAIVVVVFAEAIEMIEDDEYDPDDPTASYRLVGNATVILLFAATVVIYLFLARLTYDLVRRHNTHFERERMLRNTVASFAARVVKGRFRFYPMDQAEPRRSPALWAAVIVVPSLLSMLWILMLTMEAEDGDFGSGVFALSMLLQVSLGLLLLVAEFYLFYFLTADMAGHHKRWMAFVSDTKAFLGNTGYTAGWLTDPRRLNDRSIAVYVVASIFTGGLFFFYWWYAIIKDGNEHFAHHRAFESDLMELLSKEATG